MSFSLDSALPLVLAVALGTAIGLERVIRHHRAGMHTNALVALGAAGFVLSESLGGPNDAMRVAAQVVTGVGFLGGGVILRHGVSVRGLNAAATIWCSAAAGLLAGLKFYATAIVFTALVVAAN